MTGKVNLQQQICEYVLENIQAGIFNSQALPSARKLASLLQVSRNTVVLAYRQLVSRGVLSSKERVGYFVNQKTLTKTGRDIAKASSYAPKNKSFVPMSENQCSGGILQQWFNYYRRAQDLQVFESYAMGKSVTENERLLSKHLKDQVIPNYCQQKRQLIVTRNLRNTIHLITLALLKPNMTVYFDDIKLQAYCDVFTCLGIKTVFIPKESRKKLSEKQWQQCDLFYTYENFTEKTMIVDDPKCLFKAADQYNFKIIEQGKRGILNRHETNTGFNDYLVSHKQDNLIYVNSVFESNIPGVDLAFCVACPDVIKTLKTLQMISGQTPGILLQGAWGHFLKSKH
ncbi:MULTISPECIES: GntR family transcriptional regulator [unclassified Vibrio]|uniref:GntR family transcriptional regulator n=1 Tax=Vibrio sp. HB236076 TaxID=3232307 RepID=A0AB39HFJ5_9VIBR|nr:GntR family transcriptional regulator [Vibrio sp. HB161653]MDP5255021.1 GntR family transcriptional regulator [Vibrio sp. HB161653]